MAIQTEKRTGPLNGYKILDFTRALAGPFAAMLLADLGATVIKVEAPEGDYTRKTGPYLDKERKDSGLGGYFNSVNRNKKSIVLDLKKPEAQKIAQELAKECDAVISNFRTPQILEKYNLGYEVLHALNPKLVYVVISGYGTNRVVGSEKDGVPTVDMMMQASSGLMSITGKNEEEIYKVGPGIGDIYPGTLSIVSMLAGLIHAKDTGKGQYVEVAMQDSLMLLCERMFYQYSYTGKVPHAIGNNHPLHAPYGVFRTNDGAIAMSGHPIKYWDHFVEACDQDVFREERFATVAGRVANQDELNALIEAWTSQYTKAECMEILGAHKCLAAPVNTAGDLFADSHVRKREMLVQVEGDPATGKEVTIAGTPFKFSETKAQVYRRAPLLGENSAEILTQLGYSEEEQKQFAESGVTIL